MWRHIAANALTLLIVVIFMAGGAVIWGKQQYDAAGPHEIGICIQVPSGGRMGAVSEDLASKGAISNALIFRLGADYTDKTQALKAGSFLIPEGASMREITDIITRGGPNNCGTEVVYRVGIARIIGEVRELDPATGRMNEVAEFDLADEARPEAYETVRAEDFTQYRLVVAEGVTSWQVVEALKAIEPLEGEIAEVPAEGSLAPDSYALREGDDRSAILEMMAARQASWLAEAWAGRQEDLPLESPEEALILASIVEKETGIAEERALVASVFINRLTRGMRLQTDPTVIYGITQGQGVLGRGLRRSELDAATPYNTYQIDGLPPTPIANPGRAAIRAALNPAESDFVYFVADGTGGHAFARTLDEHNRNVAEWRRIEAERANQ
ncbi:endolytic transglycosylase MltG [Poseidonocella sedimentorum]|uniref:Endolytic murein transglycosylase n=1 Tax=Poseidonocella sedimentorum TaxID=871652 RepID=A0A1I6DHC6_9RHOB|nr:endolytic transglycosylase MltG [Poseidonocella sedimentorum]SFR04797.1 UPF0755 protein [Poseidonocella sedimentorum]